MQTNPLIILPRISPWYYAHQKMELMINEMSREFIFQASLIFKLLINWNEVRCIVWYKALKWLPIPNTIFQIIMK